jgi:hypothetical protein
MNHPTNTVTAAILSSLVLLLPLTATAAAQQDKNADKSQQSDAKKPEEKKTETKKIEVHVKVSAKDGKPLPPATMVEISGKEKACGALNSNDATAAINAKGEATFSLPACKVTIKVHVALYMPAIKQVDLAEDKSPITLTLEHEH